MERIWPYLIPLSELLNFWTGGRADETFSSRVGGNVFWGRAPLWLWIALEAMINVLAWPFEDDHCYRSYCRENGIP